MNTHTLRIRLLGIFLASIGFSNPVFAVLPNGVQDVTGTMANNSPTLVSFVPDFTFINTAGYILSNDPTPGADGIYYNVSVGSGDFTVAADGTNVGIFDLTALNFTNFSGTANYDFTITGTKADLSPDVTTTFTATGTAFTPGNYASFTGLTGFRVQFSGTNNTNPSNITFDSFTIANAAAPVTNTPPTLGGTFTTAGMVNDNANISPFSSVTVSDADADNVSVSITYTTANGTLSGTGVTGSAGSYTVTSAAPATATSNLQGIVFTPTANQVAPGSTVVTSFTLTPNDGTVNGTANSTTQVTAISINDAPVITSNGGGATGSTAINENTTAVTTVTSTDADTGETYTYSISGGLDQALFNINSSSGALTFASAPNYESPADNGANNVYDVQVTVTDNGTGTLTDVQDIAVTVNNINDNPVITSDGGGASASVNVAENQTAVTTVTATDQDTADTLTYSISGGADSAKFNINSSTGVLTFASAPNYESPTDSGANNVYDVQVTVTDNGAGTLTDVQAIAVTVTNVNEAPVITSNGGGATASTSINENSTAVTTVTATDVDAADTLTYAISGGADSAKFSINSSTGALVFASAPNYESPTDSGANNIYDVQVTVTDNGSGTLTDVQAIAVTVNNINDTPLITSDGGGATASVNAPENQTAVTTVTATDQDPADTLTYSISGGADQALFNINSSTGVLTFASAPNFELPTDSGTNGVYDVQVTVTDNGVGTLTDVQAIAVTVTNVNEAPVITSNGGGATASTSINENSTAVTTVTATDVDAADTLTYAISGGADSAKFSINSSTGALVFASAPNYESPTDSGANNIYDVQVTVTDNGSGTLTDVQAIAVTVNNINENPVISSDGGGASASVNAAENQTAVTTVTATDQDTADTLTYSISGGADSAKFSINSSTGVLTFASAPNYESPTDSGANNVYDVQVTVTDNGVGTLTDVQAIAVTVTNVNEAPVITSNGGGATASSSINENSTAVTTVTATDVDAADTLTYAISGGADSAKFSINSSTGALVFASAPNYESPTDSGANNIYDVQVTVTDNGTGTLTDVQDIAVTVNNINEAPVISSNGGGVSAAVNAPENQAAVTTVTATDQDTADTLTYSISGGADSAKFSINSSTGVLTFASAPNYESPTDSGANNVYDVQVKVTDNGAGTLTDVQAIAVTVTNVNEVPVNTVLPVITGNALEGITLSASSGTWTDADGDTPTYSFQWKAAGSDIAAATNSTYLVASGDVGKVITVAVTANDGHGGIVTATSAATTTVDSDLDGDGIGDASDPDIDGDGMLNTYEDANGLDKRDASDRDTDLDGDGVSNYDESVAGSHANADDYPPVVTSPADVTVDAVGLFTPVSIGSASAVDGLDGSLTPTSDAPSHFAPGVHTVTWSATDAAGNTGTATQTVNVNPLVNFSKDQTTAEGSTVTFSVILNGPAANYPVEIPYAVSGTASTDGSDHTLTDGIATINSGTTVMVSFTTVDDGPGEGTENIVITMGTPSNAVAGAKASHTIALVEGNVAPAVSLDAVQGATGTTLVPVGDGVVTVTANAVDPNPGDTLTYDWSASDNALVDSDGANDTFTFDPSVLSPGLYTLRLSVSDGTASDTAELSLNVIAAAPVLTTADSDGDGSDDLSEGYGDSDNDGVPDYLDAIPTGNVLQEQSGVSRSHVVETEVGLHLQLNKFALRTGNGRSEVGMADIAGLGGMADDASRYAYPGGLFDFTITGLPVAGQSVKVVLAQLAPIPTNPVYRKLMSGGWQEFVADANNSVASAAGEEGYCPPPGDAAYSAGLTEGYWCVQLTIEDGGANDFDGRANKRIVDPGGVAAILATDVNVEVSSGGGSVAPLWLVLLGLLGLPGLLAVRKGRAGK